MFIIPDVIRGLSHILQFSTRVFPREFPYLYKKNKHHRCINPKTAATLLPYYLFLCRHYVPSSKLQGFARPLNCSNAAPQLPISTPPPIVSPKVNQAFICLRKNGAPRVNPERPSNGMEGAASA